VVKLIKKERIMTYKVYKTHNNSTDEDHFFVGFKDSSNFGHGSDSDTISTNDSRFCLGGTRCYDISGEQTFLPFLLKEITSIQNDNEKLLLDAALKNSGLEPKDIDVLQNDISIVTKKVKKLKHS
jgi:hypothetical protein